MQGSLLPDDLERQYRQNRLEEDFASARIVLGVTALGVALFLVNDHRLFGTADPFKLLVAIRVGICALSIFVWARLRSAVRSLRPEGFDRALLTWGIVIALAQVFVGFTRPASYTTHFLVHLFTVLLTYCVLPLPTRKQLVPALLMSGGMIACMVWKRPADGLTFSALAWTLFAGNALGASISRRLERSRRLQFLALTRETQARVGLEAALAELQTLRGIIPICAHCKSIRDDAGAWHHLEEYITAHSDAEFSHGICPPCIEKFYP